MLPNVKTWVFICICVSIWLSMASAAGIPMVSPPAVNTPSVQVSLSNGIPDAVTVAGAGYQAAVPDTITPLEVKYGLPSSKGSPESTGTGSITSGGDGQSVQADSWHYLWNIPFTYKWGVGCWGYRILHLTNGNHVPLKQWKVVLTAPVNNMDLKIFEKNKKTGRWDLVKKSTGATSREVITWMVKDDHDYKFYIYKVSGPVARYTATLKFYAS